MKYIYLIGLMAFSLSVNAQKKQLTKKDMVDSLENLVLEGCARLFGHFGYYHVSCNNEEIEIFNNGDVRYKGIRNKSYTPKVKALFSFINKVHAVNRDNMKSINARTKDTLKLDSGNVGLLNAKNYGIYSSDRSRFFEIDTVNYLIIREKDVELLRDTSKGEIYHLGKKLTTDTAIVNGLKAVFSGKVDSLQREIEILKGELDVCKKKPTVIKDFHLKCELIKGRYYKITVNSVNYIVELIGFGNDEKGVIVSNYRDLCDPKKTYRVFGDQRYIVGIDFLMGNQTVRSYK